MRPARSQTRLFAGAALAAILGAAGLAHAQASDADGLARAGKHREAAEAYLRAFEQSRDPSFWKQAGLQYLELGADGRDDAIRAFRLYVQNADDEAQAEEGRALLARAKALPEAATAAPAPEAPAPPVPPVDSPAAAPLPPATPPTPAPGAPPADEPASAERVEDVAGAHWSPNVGFTQPAPEGNEPAPTPTVVPVVPPLPVLTLDQTTLTLAVGSLRLNPVNDGVTDDLTRLNLIEFDVEVETRGRPIGAVFGPWFGLESRFALGKRSESAEYATSATGRELSMIVVHLGGRFGFDLFPTEFFGVGPLVGYRMDGYVAKLEADADAATSSGEDARQPLRPDHGPEIGLHARLGTLPRPAKPARFVTDFQLAQRFGKARSVYSGVEARLWLGGIYLVGWAEGRVRTNADFTFVPGLPEGALGETDALDLSDAFARSSPIERRLGGGIALIPGGAAAARGTP